MLKKAKEHYGSRMNGYLGLLNKNGLTLTLLTLLTLLTSLTTLYMKRELCKLARA